MRKLLFSQLSREDIAGIVKLHEHGTRRDPWEDLARGELSAADMQVIERVTTGLQRFQPSLANEATVWGRAIFPLLCLAETDRIVAQADVPLQARLADVELLGSADGAFGTPISGELRAPFLIVVEAKRGVEGANPVAQLYGELLAAACINAGENGQSEQPIFGVYTVGESWTFVRAVVAGLDGPRPSMSVVSSWEIVEKLEATTIVRILRSIIARHGVEGGAA